MARAIATPQRGPHVADLVELEQSLEAQRTAQRVDAGVPKRGLLG